MKEGIVHIIMNNFYYGTNDKIAKKSAIPYIWSSTIELFVWDS